MLVAPPSGAGVLQRDSQAELRLDPIPEVVCSEFGKDCGHRSSRSFRDNAQVSAPA
jgi:hypothetical protein